MIAWRKWIGVVVLVSAMALAGCSGSSPTVNGAAGPSGSPGSNNPPPAAGAAPVIKVLANRADLINGPDTLVEVDPPAGVDASALKVSLNGQDVTQAFGLSAQGKFMGLVKGLVVGDNTLSATAPGAATATVTIVDHPQGGPVISGPQLHPWKCEQGAVDAKCDKPATYVYYYKSTDTSKQALQPYDPKNPAKDVATTTTADGVTVPFIVRVETGYQDRDQYSIAVLYQPGQPWSARDPQKQFIHKLVINHGHACGVDYETASAPSVISYNPINSVGGKIPLASGVISAIGGDTAVYALGQGFAIMSTALDISGHNCNLALQAESLMMAKEHLIEKYGTLKYTIGEGCSGGALAMYWIANGYPGIYQGILPTCSFPDAWSTATQFLDYHLLLAYFKNPLLSVDHGGLWTEAAMADVEGSDLTLNSEVSDLAQFSVAVPTSSCGGITSAELYNPLTNPSGTRCDIQDAAINVLGPMPQTTWTKPEREAAAVTGHGFAAFPVDNVGVQYGLDSLRRAIITPAMFVDLNKNIGGLDIDTNPIPQRMAATRQSLANAYRSGMINEANNLGNTAVIDCRGPDPGLFHDAYRAFAVRARLDRAYGNHNNQVIWEGGTVIIADTKCALNSFKAMNRWLSAVSKDTSGIPLRRKLTRDKPSDITDECWSGVGTKTSSHLCLSVKLPGLPPGLDDVGIVPLYKTPRMIAGDGITTDANKCQLKPLNRHSKAYGLIPFTDKQWAEMKQIFPNGVCDYSKPGVEQQPTIAWQTYQNADGDVIYGGKALPPAPANSGEGWASPAFEPFSTSSGMD